MLRRWLVDPEFDAATCAGTNLFDAFVHTGSQLVLGAAHQFEQGPPPSNTTSLFHSRFATEDQLETDRL